MNPEFALHLSDARLLQTLRLLETSLRDHPDQEAVREAIEAISSSRDIIANLAAAPAPAAQSCA